MWREAIFVFLLLLYDERLLGLSHCRTKTHVLTCFISSKCLFNPLILFFIEIVLFVIHYRSTRVTTLADALLKEDTQLGSDLVYSCSTPIPPVKGGTASVDSLQADRWLTFQPRHAANICGDKSNF